MTRSINLFGFDFEMSFSGHAKKRSVEREVPWLLVLNALEDAEEAIGDYVKDGRDFVVQSEFYGISVVAVMHFKGDSIDIKTVMDTADCHTRATDTVIRVKKDGSLMVELPKEIN